jgi:hypothetical protein
MKKNNQKKSAVQKVEMPQNEVPNLFRDPTPQEVDAALEQIVSDFFDEEMRDLEFPDHWQRHCLDHVWKHYRATAPASSSPLVRFG